MSFTIPLVEETGDYLTTLFKTMKDKFSLTRGLISGISELFQIYLYIKIIQIQILRCEWKYYRCDGNTTDASGNTTDASGNTTDVTAYTDGILITTDVPGQYPPRYVY